MSDPGLVDRVRRRLAADTADPTPQSVATALRAEQRLTDSATVLTLVDELRRETLGVGPLEPLLAVDGVTDILVNGPDAVYLDRGGGLEHTRVRFPDDEAVRRLAQRLAAQAGRRLDDASPWVDARLPDGTRLHAVLAPLARPGTLVSLRIPARRTFTLEQLVAAGTLTPGAARWLQRLIDARVAFVVSGGTGSGKTTLLAALLSVCEPAERLVIVEDATELRPDHPHVVGLESRPANVEGAGLVTLRDLVRQALRMRPDRVVVGEVRGAEVVDLLAALNTGHEGGCGTVHANSSSDVPARFEALGVAAGLPRAAVHSQLGAGLDAVLHLGRDRSGTRRLQQIGVLRADTNGLARTVAALTFADGVAEPGPGRDRLAELVGEGS
ncbi:TadA family conjugal transfer-associated ATPase [Aeromicrobium sp.]|uniref:TadA family conjugal transfer-associated ATPase n=1 Tax=Aeromicrobium sp. TaxID=1871063 RepID=UPI003D6A13C4